MRGMHDTISGCSLPPWTPTAYVKEMNQSLGGKLRISLLKIIEDANEQVHRDRSSSTGSGLLSDRTDGSHSPIPYSDNTDDDTASGTDTDNATDSDFDHSLSEGGIYEA